MNTNQLRDLQIERRGGIDRRDYDWENMKIPTEMLWILKSYVDSKERLNTMLMHYKIPSLDWLGEAEEGITNTKEVI